MTARQRQVLDFIVQLTADKGHPPTLRDLQGALGLSSTSSVATHLYALRRKGHISWTPGATRTIVVVNP